MSLSKISYPQTILNATVTDAPKVMDNFNEAKDKVNDIVDELNIELSGEIRMYGGSTAPTSWLLCDGSAISRSTYSDLFSTIGEKYGVGDGSTTFNVPDFQAKFPVGYKSGDADFGDRGDTGGAKTKSISHTHTGPNHTHSVSGTSGNIKSPNLIGGTGTSQYSGDHAHDFACTSGAGGTGNTGAGGSGAQDVLNPFLVVNFIIKT